jgi:hypothetical protein
MIRRPKRTSTANKKAVETSDNLIRQNSATVYGLYFASSNTDFLLDEKKTRFSLRPSVVVKPDRQTVMFDYSQVTGDEASIFDGFFRGLSAGATLTLDGGIESTCNFINEVTGVPLTNFADTYTISTVDVSKKILVATKGTTITSTTASVFDGRYFIDLPQWTKTQTNEDSTSISKILNLLPSQSISHLGVVPGSVLEFAKTSKNNSRYTVESIYTQNGIECIDVTEQVVQEDASEEQVIVSVYGEEPPVSESSSYEPVLYVTTGALGGDCEPPIYGPMPTPMTGKPFKDWLKRDMECCKCLVYAEAECNDDQCQICNAWVIWNRRRDRVPGGAIPPDDGTGRDEDSYCDMARLRNRFSGGWGAKKFNECFCKTTDNSLEKRCIKSAEKICNQIGHSNYRGMEDPTGGANYFFRDGAVPGWMDCNVQAGHCTKVTNKKCGSCGNVFYKCDIVPKPCDELGKKPGGGEDVEPDDTPVVPA